MSRHSGNVVQRIYDRLYRHYGPQHWWPGDTRLEIITGAILTQNTHWRNVEKAIVNLKDSNLLSLQALRDISPGQLARQIRPSGFFNVKTKRLKNFIRFIFEEYGGDLDRMRRAPLDVLRRKILSVQGIGPETADSILLYAFQKPVFVIDAYTKRILSRHGLVDEDAGYDGLQRYFMDRLRADERMFNEYHALLVRIGKEYCKPSPLCERCPLNISGMPPLKPVSSAPRRRPAGSRGLLR